MSSPSNATQIEGMEIPVNATRTIRRIIDKLDDSLYQSPELNSAIISNVRLRFRALARSSNRERTEKNCLVCLTTILREIEALVAVM